jgi:proline iminopeptidase
MQWGASSAEVAGPYPGGDVVPHGDRGATMAVTIDASPAKVWPWLVQLGGDRGGWYSWDLLDNAGRPSAQEVHPEWQDIAVGDHVKYWSRRYGPVAAWQVAVLEPNRFLGLHGLSDLRGRSLESGWPRPSAYTEGLWGFQLKELPGGKTRLVVGGYQTIRPRWLGRFLSYWLYPPIVWVMQARMLAVLTRNVERTPTETTPQAPGPERRHSDGAWPHEFLKSHGTVLDRNERAAKH